MAFQKKTWHSVGESGATDDNSTLNATTMNDLENRIANLENALTKLINDINIFTIPTKSIPENADLNDYNELGTYGSFGAANSATLKNIPPNITSSFKLIVEKVNYDTNIRQTLYTNTANCSTYIRYGSLSGWGKWYKVDMTTV